MEIGSISGMQQGMAVGQMRPPPPPEDSEEASDKMSSLIMEQQDADGDGLLSAEELGGSGSGLIDSLDEDGDGFVSQEELQAGIQSNMEAMKSSFESGVEPGEADVAFMEQMQSLAGQNPATQSKATEAYGLMQDAMFGGSQEAASYNVDQLLLENLSMTV